MLLLFQTNCGNVYSRRPIITKSSNQKAQMMTFLTNERPSTHRAESTGEILFKRQLQLARAVLPHTVNEAADAPFIDVEDTLAQLTVEASESLSHHKKPTRKLRRRLSKYAHRLLEITNEEPDLLDTRSILLLGQSYDATGERDILETTLEQARYAGVSFDTNLNLQAIEAALELDKPFGDVMRTLNSTVIPVNSQPGSTLPLPEEYDYLFDSSIDHHVSRGHVLKFDANHEPIDPNINRPLFKD